MFFKKEVFSMWLGPELSIMEQACISSYLSKDITFILYIYEPLKNIPQGTIIENGNKIIPYEKYKKYNNPSFFSNLFRYKRLYELGGIWVDTDLICLQPLDKLLTYNEYIFSSEISKNQQHINAGIIGCPQRSLLMLDCYNEVKRTIKTKEVKQGMLGPKLLKNNVEKHQLEHYTEPYFVFCVYGYKEIEKIFLQKDKENILNDKEILGLHLWNNIVSKSKDNLKTVIRKDSIYCEIIKKFYNKNLFHAVVPTFEILQNSILNNSLKNNLNICLCTSETSVFETKKYNPSCYIILLKKDLNTFVSSINKTNTRVYSLVDEYNIENFSHYSSKKKIIIKHILKINV
jgi:hypothetical protein